MRLLGGEKYVPLLPPLRPWQSEFLGPMMRPSIHRVETNINYYVSNYLVLCTVVLLISVFFTGVALIVCPVIGYMIYFTMIRQANEMVLGGKVNVTKNMVLVASSCLCVLLVIFTGHWKNLVVSYAVSTLMIVIHMLCRERQASKHKGAANTFKSSHRIFDPDEMLRSSMTQQPTSFATGYQPYQQQQHQQQHQQQQHQPQSQHFSSTYQPQLQSQLPLQQSYVSQPQLGATTRMESPSASTGQRSTIAARYENRQQSTRQRMQEYGIE